MTLKHLYPCSRRKWLPHDPWQQPKQVWGWKVSLNAAQICPYGVFGYVCNLTPPDYWLKARPLHLSGPPLTVRWMHEYILSSGCTCHSWNVLFNFLSQWFNPCMQHLKCVSLPERWWLGLSANYAPRVKAIN
jgi:hypothetical protein